MSGREELRAQLIEGGWHEKSAGFLAKKVRDFLGAIGRVGEPTPGELDQAIAVLELAKEVTKARSEPTAPNESNPRGPRTE